MTTRRQFLRASALFAAGLLVPWRQLAPDEAARVEAQSRPPAQVVLNRATMVRLNPTVMAATLDPTSIPKYVAPLVIPPAMPPFKKAGKLVTYTIAVKQFDQQVLPTGYPKTKVWGYGNAAGPAPGKKGSTYNYPSFTIEARRNEQVTISWINDLVDQKKRYVPHLLPVDQTLHWANPPGPRDMHGTNPAPYTGPVPMVTHVHGAHVKPVSDGYPEAWYLPIAVNIPKSYARRGTRYGSVLPPTDGSATFQYPNDQRAATLWFHDHSLGLTRLNVYAGMAGFWLLRDAEEDALKLPGPAPKVGDAPGKKYYEIPLAIQDRMFKQDGSLFYPDSRAFFDGYTGPYRPETPVPPIWNPEFFGDTMVVNGRTWPYLEVEPRKYRLRMVNGCQARFLILKLASDPEAERPAPAALPFYQIGAEGGLLPDAPAQLEQLLMGPGERADVIVDFSSLAEGDEIYMINESSDEPFGGLPIDSPADPATTGQVMKFKVVALTAPDTSVLPASLPAVPRLTTTLPDRILTLNEEAFDTGIEELGEIPVAALLGTADDGPRTWMDPITEKPRLGSTEVWQIANLTMDAHPIHLHLVTFQVIERIPIDAEAYGEAQAAWIEGGKSGPRPEPLQFTSGDPLPPEPAETGYKDTVIAYPDMVTRIIAKFDIAGLYVWHCHIIDHEDNEMMRPFEVVKG